MRIRSSVPFHLTPAAKWYQRHYICEMKGTCFGGPACHPTKTQQIGEQADVMAFKEFHETDRTVCNVRARRTKGSVRSLCGVNKNRKEWRIAVDRQRQQ